ncbi:hypothetical protein BY996DRAFT_6592330 [Phakopsora pachyrhizi]|nr:hypothetical protein BY996DRAFT_6592330 [Phakopsora pachyrhizi]
MEAKRQLKEEQAKAKRQANALPVWISQSHLTTITNSSKNAEDANFDAYIARLQSQPSVDPHALAPMFDDRRYGYQAEIDQKNWWSPTDGQNSTLISSKVLKTSPISPVFHKPKDKTLFKQLMSMEKGHAAITRQLQCGYAPLNARLFKAHCVTSPQCPHCGSKETVTHLLLHCPKYRKQRRTFRKRLKNNNVKTDWSVGRSVQELNLWLCFYQLPFINHFETIHTGPLVSLISHGGLSVGLSLMDSL